MKVPSTAKAPQGSALGRTAQHQSTDNKKAAESGYVQVPDQQLTCVRAVQIGMELHLQTRILEKNL